MADFPSSTELVDFDELKEEYEEDLDILGTTIEGVIKGARELLTELEAAVQAKDAAQTKFKAHTLKGVLSNVFALSVPELLARLEQFKEIDGEAESLLAEVKTKSEGVLAELTDFMSKNPDLAA